MIAAQACFMSALLFLPCLVCPPFPAHQHLPWAPYPSHPSWDDTCDVAKTHLGARYPTPSYMSQASRQHSALRNSILDSFSHMVSNFYTHTQGPLTEDA